MDIQYFIHLAQALFVAYFIAPDGQAIMHLSHLIHFDDSMTGIFLGRVLFIGDILAKLFCVFYLIKVKIILDDSSKG